jgi:hypothetical protein
MVAPIEDIHSQPGMNSLGSIQGDPIVI